MPILTPLWDNSVNTATQIVPSTLAIYADEFARAYKLIKKVLKGKIAVEALFNMPPTELFDFKIQIEMTTLPPLWFEHI
jgi:poly(A) polymerase Pap1